MRGARLAERAHEQAALAEAVAALADERGGLIVVEGAGGIGKTSLLRCAADLAAERQALVLRATAHDLERDLPFGVVRQLFEPRWRRLDAAERAALLTSGARHAAPLLEGGAPGDPGSLQHGLHRLLCNLAERQPVVLVVDDAHLADVASLRFLVYVASRLEDVAILGVVAHRPVGEDEAGRLLRHLRAAPGAQRLALAPLTRAAVARLVAEAGMAGAAPEFVAACAESTGGNPLYVGELLAVVAQRGIPATAEGGDEVRELGPVAVAEAVYLALSHHPPAATALVRALAVLGDGSRAADVAQLAAVPVTEVPVLAASLARDGLLDGGERLAFVHPVVGTAVLDDLRAGELAYAHAVAAGILRDRGEDEAVIAAHLLKAEPLPEGDWPSAVLLCTAETATAAGQHATAVRLLRAALDAAGDRAEVLAALAAAEAAAGEERAVDRYGEAIAAAEHPERRASLRLGLGRALVQRGQFGAAAAAFAAGRDEAAGSDADLAAELNAAWAGAALWDADQGADAYTSVVEAISGLTDPRTAGERGALANLARALLIRAEDHERALDLARRAWGDGALLEALGPEDFTLYAVTAVLVAADAPAEADAVYRAIRDEARQRGLQMAAAAASFGVASCHLRVGALADAAAEAEQALDAERHGWALFAAGSRWVAALAHLARGRLGDAERVMDLAPEHAARLRATINGRSLDLAEAELALARGEGERAVAVLAGLAEVERRVGVLIGQFNWRPVMVRALLLTGEGDRARAVADESLALCRRWGAPTLVGGALLHRALAAGAADERLALLEEAVATLATTAAALDHAQARTALGTALRARGDRAAARDHLRIGLDLASGCGAEPLVATARAEMVAAGGRPRRVRSTGVEALTSGELQVARMAALGRTNRQIAEALFVTTKAVKWHLGNAYKKLGVSSRAELPDALGRQQGDRA